MNKEDKFFKELQGIIVFDTMKDLYLCIKRNEFPKNIDHLEITKENFKSHKHLCNKIQHISSTGIQHVKGVRDVIGKRNSEDARLTISTWDVIRIIQISFFEDKTYKITMSVGLGTGNSFHNVDVGYYE